MKKLLAIILSLVLLTSNALAFDFSIFTKKDTAEAPASEPAETAAGIETFEGAGYASPEEAALAYAEALKNQDAAAAISTFAIESYVENADFDARAERMGSFHPAGLTGMIPTENAYFRQVQVYQRLAVISDYMLYAYLTAIWDEELLSEGIMIGVRFNDEMTPEALREILAQGEAELGFDQIEVLGVVDIRGLDEEVVETYYKERNQEQLAKLCKDYGGDDIADAIVQLRINGVEYLQFMHCIRYGDSWYNLQQLSNIGTIIGLDTYTGGLIPKAALYE